MVVYLPKPICAIPFRTRLALIIITSIAGNWESDTSVYQDRVFPRSANDSDLPLFYRTTACVISSVLSSSNFFNIFATLIWKTPATAAAPSLLEPWYLCSNSEKASGNVWRLSIRYLQCIVICDWLW